MAAPTWRTRELPILEAIAAGLLAVALLAGCSVFVARETPPTGFTGTACRAYDALRLGWGLLAGGSGGSQGYIHEANLWLDGIPEWDPGAVFVVQLDRMRDVLESLEGYSPRSRRLIFEASRIPDLAAAEYRALYDKHGFSCVLTPVPLPSPSP